jgi:thioredoxin reductase (NADPH)
MKVLLAACVLLANASLVCAGFISAMASIYSGKVHIVANDTPGSKEKSKPVEKRDVVIIGSGPAGCTAAIYTGRALLNPLMLAGYNAGGQLMLTSDVENFPGYVSAPSGPELMGDLMGQARKFGADIWQTDAKSVDLSTYPYVIETHNSTVEAKAIIISTGAEALWLGAENEEEYKGKGISTCATCDGYLFRDKPVVVIGGGDSAMEEANFLTRFASKVTLIHRRDSFKASKVMVQRVHENEKIRVLTHRRVARWHGKGGVLAGLTLEDPRDNSLEDIECEGAFIAIGHRPNTRFLKGQISLEESGYVRHYSHTMTSKPGVFACGDVADMRYKQAITAAGQGCQAALDAEKWLENINQELK